MVNKFVFIICFYVQNVHKITIFIWNMQILTKKIYKLLNFDI